MQETVKAISMGTTNTGRLVRVVVVVALAVFAIAICFDFFPRNEGGSPHAFASAAGSAELPTTSSPSLLPEATLAQSDPKPQIEPHDESRAVRQAVAVERPSSARSQADEHWNGMRRSDFDLARYFLKEGDRLRSDRLLRHAVLNITDSPVREPDLSELETIVLRHRTVLTAVLARHRESELAEMMDAIEHERVEPGVPRPRSETEVKSLADLLQKSAAESGNTASREVLEDAVRQTPTYQGSHIRTGGKIYPFANFKTLPRTDAAFDEVRFFALEALMEISAWFDAKGLADTEKLIEAVQRARSISPAELRR